MANRSQPSDGAARLKAENRRLREENDKLTALLAREKGTPQHKRSFGRKTGVLVFSLLAVVLLFAGNILFWTGNTLVKTDRYVDAVEPLIREEEIQKAISSYATQQLFQSVNVEELATEALPPRAAFLAPTLSDQVEQNAQKVIVGILANPAFQDKWNAVQTGAHQKFISQVEQHGSDGTIDFGELYSQQISPQLKETKLAFLADKPLPAKAGSIKIAEGSWLSRLETLISNINTWRTIAILLLLVFSALAIWLGRNRRKTVISLGLLFSVSMFITLVCIRLAREVVAGRVDAQYADAARQAAQTILHPLAIQTATILALGLLVAFVAWISGPSKNAKRVSETIQGLFSGRLHSALFKKENGFTLWMGRNKTVLQWGVIVVIALTLLIIRITPRVLTLAALVALVLVLIIEALSAKSANRQSRQSHS